MDGYGQYCPIAKAAEVFDQRWTLLVIRELVAGSDRFNDIHRGVPRMSRTLLSKRLTQLAEAGLVQRRDGDGGPRYQLTDAGEELEPVLHRIGEWGMRWLDSLNADELDPASLLWDVQRRVRSDALPDGQTVLALTFTDIEPELRHWWLLMTAHEIEVCDDDPGHAVDVTLTTPIRTFVRVWRGDIDWPGALRGGEMQLHGPEHLRRQLPAWFQLSWFAPVSR